MSTSSHKRILAFDVRASKFSFAVFEGPEELLDWGERNFRHGVNAVAIPASHKVAALLSEYEPDAVVLEEISLRKNGRLLGTIKRLTKKQRIPLRIVSRASIRAEFPTHDQGRHVVVMAIVERFPELADRAPSKRKAWQSEDYRMSIFDAVAIGLTYIRHQRPPQY
jgi:hypothetical protein